MEQEKKSIMVTWDFSDVSFNALKHAIKMSQDCEIQYCVVSHCE